MKNSYKNNKEEDSVSKPAKKKPSAKKKPTKKKSTSKSKEKKSIKSRIYSSLPFLADERVKKIFGVFLVLISLFVCLSCVSYIVTGNHDLRIILSENLEQEPYQNVAGKIGALTGWFLMNQYFGVAALLIPLLVFIVGVKAWLGKILLPMGKTFRLSLLGLFVIPVLIGFFLHKPVPEHQEVLEINFNENLIGAYGHVMTSKAFFSIGKIGTFLVLLLVFGALILFNFPKSSAWLKNSFSSLFAGNTKENSSEEESDEAIEGSVGSKEVNQIKTKKDSTEKSALDETLDFIVNERDEEGGVSFTKPVNEDNIELETVVTESKEPIDLDPVVPPTEAKAITEKEELVIETVKEEVVLSEDELDDKVKEFGEYDPKLDLSRYELPTIELLEEYGDGHVSIDREELERNKKNIVETLNNYNIGISKIKATVGPTITLYEIIPAPGVRISKIKNLEDDIALSLAALGIRIIAPMPGKGTVGIEVPNSNPNIVAMKSLIASDKFQNSKHELPCALGKTISNETLVADLAKMPHLLMAGATGQGKSVGLNAILVSLLYKKHPSQIKFVLVDPKKVELTLFNKIEKHFLAMLPGDEEAIITDTSKVVKTLNSLCVEMDNRYEMLKKAQVRNLVEYNKKFIQRKLNPTDGHQYLPYIVLVVDEFADLIMTAGKEVETPIARLAQLARAIGIHLIIATQRPSVNIITGTIKANFPARIAFRVTSKVDSRTILDAGGADQLIGRGDMLYSTGSDLTRLQCGFVDTPEVEKICDYIGLQQGYPSAFELPEFVDESSGPSGILDDDRDELFEEAAKMVVLHQQGSASLLQRKLKLGYNRAGRLIDQLEAGGIIGPHKGSKARDVLIPDEIILEQYLKRGE